MRRDAKLAFRPELLNRLDKTVVFRKLETPDLAAVLAKEIVALNLSLKPRGFDVSLSKSALASLTDKCLKADTGARAVRQIIQENVENELANHLLAKSVKKRRRFSVDARKGELTYNVR
jgi:ATP-dependent Clp protease ATP-binding subunit ClpA